MPDDAVGLGLVRGFVGRETDVAVLAKHLDLAFEPLAEFVEQRLHLTADRLLIEIAVGLEVVAAVVRLEAFKPLPHRRSETAEVGHGKPPI